MISRIYEHYNGQALKREYDFEGDLSFNEDYSKQFYRKSRNEKIDCFRIYSDSETKTHAIANSYFVGVDWIIEEKKAIYVQPKLDEYSQYETDYLQMLFSALKHEEVSKHTVELFEIKWDKPTIAITQQEDLLTPLLIVEFLTLVKQIVRKGLKKSYYKVENNLHSKVKGKVLISRTIKQNLVKNKPLHTFCSYDEFGFNGLENRLLKKALSFVERYLPTIKNLQTDNYTTEIFNYINPAFQFVSEEVSLYDVKNTKTNVFYKEYKEAIHLAKLILKRFGYNVSNTQEKTINTPPFWIDMSKLFELYVYGKLKERFPLKNDVKYLFKTNYQELDFIIDSKLENYQMVVDAKYKPQYKEGNINKEDIRQVSGYSRMKSVYKELHKEDNYNQVIDCLIIYSDQGVGRKDFANANFREETEDNYVQFYKIGIELPTLIVNDYTKKSL